MVEGHESGEVFLDIDEDGVSCRFNGQACIIQHQLPQWYEK